MKVYVVRLEKMDELCKGCFDTENVAEDGGKSLITLGHFDRMRIYELPIGEDGLFGTLRRSNENIAQSQKGRYCQPLYLIAPEDEEWSCGDPFLAIARVHFTESVGANDTYKTMEEELKDEAEKLDCKCSAFRTIELSDMILAVSGSRLDRVLKFALTLRRYGEIGKVYTYVGVDYEKVKNTEWTPETGDGIALFSMRFSVRDFPEAKNAVEFIGGTLREAAADYSVAGVDDIVINWRNVKVENLVELYREWFIEGYKGVRDEEAGKERGGRRALQGKCFAEVTTRVGIPVKDMDEDTTEGKKAEEGEKGEGRKEDSAEKLRERCRELQRRCSEICKNSKRMNWAVPLATLTDTMERISRTPVLDEFIYIMYEGVDAFLRNMEQRPQGCDPEWIQDFVEGWGHLMEHILRVEGQLAHNPELRPVIYDIPVAMLEYTLAFLRKVSKILQAADMKEDRKEIRFLLVPRLCDRMKSQELFQADKEWPGLVLVTMPVQFMYDAETIQRELCHEASHFVGEACRDRENRAKDFGHAAAALMAREFFESDHPALVKSIWTKLWKDLKKEAGKLKEMRIRELACWIEGWIEETAKSEDLFFELLRDAMEKEGDYEENEKLRVGAENVFLDEGKKTRYRTRLSDMGILFREVYADVCMLYLLPVDIWKYIESNIQELQTKKDKSERRYEQYAIRLYVALKAAGKEGEIPWDEMEKREEELCGKMKRLAKQIKDTGERMDSIFPTFSTYDILEYAERCYGKFGEKDQEEKRKLENMFRNIVGPGREGMKYDSFLGEIDKYRRLVLGLDEEEIGEDRGPLA